MDRQLIVDEDLSAKLVAVERSAQDELHRRYIHRLQRYCRYLLQDLANAADAVHNTYLAVSGEPCTSVREAVNTLRPIYREAVVLRECEGLTSQEIAQTAGVPLSTVKFNWEVSLLSQTFMPDF